MNIDEMPAGREMDALVAEKVMGWSEIHHRNGRLFGMPPEATVIRGDDVILHLLPILSYSTDIGAAWEIMIIIRMTASLSLEHPLTAAGLWQAKFENRGEGTWHDEVTVCAMASTAPLAICRAALKFMGCMERMYGENVRKCGGWSRRAGPRGRWRCCWRNWQGHRRASEHRPDASG